MGAEILNQDEIDALLKGVDTGAVPAATDLPAEGEARNFDLATQVRIVRGRMPTLEMINDRLGRLLRLGIFNMIRRTPEITAVPVQVMKFSEYVQTLPMPSSLNMVKINPLARYGAVRARSEAGVRGGGQFLWWQRTARQDRGPGFHPHREPHHPDGAAAGIHGLSRSLGTGCQRECRVPQL